MRTEAKEAPINIRAKSSQRELIDVAAKLLSKSRTDFILEAACREAEEVLLDQRLFLVDDSQFDAFINALEKPVATNERLQALLNRKSPWE
ncbi:type II toxin-antitoxin system TacA family antitoxin [Pectobacterium cacticida]|uniref:type II toxin-antitoxin system TacA family antitoxin n=1 Tax=Pectobacterium cacticida TaxID=69221 RepID=UPI0039871F28